MMNIRKIIQEELSRVFSENHQLGPDYDSHAPWNQIDNTREGDKAAKIDYKLMWADEEFALFKDAAGNTFVFYVAGLDKSEFEPYAERDEFFLGRDEDGMPEVEYGDWDITGEAIENYVNENLGASDIGRGVEDYESGNYNLILIDEELKDYLVETSTYIKDEKRRLSFLSALGK